MKKMILGVLLCLPLALWAQDGDKYLTGAVPVVDGKVTFTTELTTAGMNKEQIFQTILDWANKRYQPDETFNDRVLYQNLTDGKIAVNGEEYLTFRSSALSLDRTRIYYQLQVFCKDNQSQLKFTRIHYWYDEERDGGEKYTAEEWITDEMALNKSKTKLYPITGKFRKGTIDLKDKVFEEIHVALGNQMIALGLQAAPVSPQAQVVVNTPQTVQAATPVATPVVTPVVTPVEKEPVQTVQDSKDPATIIEQATRMTITAGNDEQFEISKDCWGGFGELFGKKVAFCLIDTQKTMGNMLLSQSDSYKISFYHANSNQPALVVECKKMMQQTISGEEAKKMNPSCAVEKSYNMYVGEFIK